MGTHPIFESDFDCPTEQQTREMAKVTISDVEVLNNECSFRDRFQFKIRFDCIEDLQEDLDWKFVYVGSANSSEFDQELDEVSTGPIPVGTHEFVLESDGPDPAKIPASEIVGVTVVLITCSYRNQEFVKIGYYINNEYIDEEMRENPPDEAQIDKLRRIVSRNPRVTRLQINWDGTENIVPTPVVADTPQPFGFELSNSISTSDNGGMGNNAFVTGAKNMEMNSQPNRPPVFVENSMDCHNVAMNID